MRYLILALALLMIGGCSGDSGNPGVGGAGVSVPSIPGTMVYEEVVDVEPTPTPSPVATPTPVPPLQLEPTPRLPDVQSVGSPDVLPQPEDNGDIVSIIHEVFGVNAGAALAVAWCESTFDPNEVGDDGERGLFQIHETHWFWMDEDLLFDPLYNTQMAFELSRGGTYWSSWTCHP